MKKINCTTHHICDCKDQKMKELKQRLSEAEKVISYYASEDTWIKKEFDKDGNLYQWWDKKPNDVSVFPYSIGKSNGNFHCLGKRARDFLERVK